MTIFGQEGGAGEDDVAKLVSFMVSMAMVLTQLTQIIQWRFTSGKSRDIQVLFICMYSSIQTWMKIKTFI